MGITPHPFERGGCTPWEYGVCAPGRVARVRLKDNSHGYGATKYTVYASLYGSIVRLGGRTE